MIKTDKGHVWIEFENGYTISIFNGFGSYSDNHFNTNMISYPNPTNDKEVFEYINQQPTSSDCEIAIIYGARLVTDDILHCGDSVKGYVTMNELVDIMNLVKNIKGDD